MRKNKKVGALREPCCLGQHLNYNQKLWRIFLFGINMLAHVRTYP